MRGMMRVLVVVGMTLSVAGVVHADEVGAVGAPAGLQINTPSADTYLQFHGRLFVKNAQGALDEYRWGGTSCGTRVLTEDAVAALQRGLATKKMYVEPLYQDGQGSALCLVGATFVPKQALKLVLP